MSNIKELVERKKELEFELKEIKKEIRKTKSKNNSNSPTILMRVPVKFHESLKDINEKREENGLDKLTNPKIFELIIRHVSWKKLMKKDLIDFNTNLDDNGGIPKNVIYQ